MNPRVRTLLMTADTVGGVFSYAVDLARALEPHGVDVALALLGEPMTRAQREELRGVPNAQVFEGRFRLEWMAEPWDDVRISGEWLLELERRIVPDCVHLGGYAHGALPFFAPVVVTAHSCVLSWWSAVKREAPPAALERYRQEVVRGLQDAQVVTAPTHAQLAALGVHYGSVPHARVIPNAVHAHRCTELPKEPFVLSAGRLWDEAKNAAALAAVAGELAWPIELCGPLGAPEGAVGTAPHPGGLRTIGALPRAALARRMARAAIYALPARYEPFGLSVLEAALCGCALVLGDIESLRENWSGAACFVAPDDHAELARTLHTLIADERARGELAARARERAASFAPSNMAAAYLSAYADAAVFKAGPAEKGAACA